MNAIQFTTVIGPDGVIHPPAGVALPEGEIEVSVRVRSAEAPTPDPLAPTRSWLLALAAEAEAAGVDLPNDMAKNHDYYAHGKPHPCQNSGNTRPLSNSSVSPRMRTCRGES